MNKQTYTSVRQVMTTEPFTIDGLATVHQAMEIMRKHNVSSLVIEKRHEGDEYGLIVVHDIAKGVIAHNKSPDRTNVYEIMSKPVLTVDADMDIKYAIRFLTRFGLSRALVLDKGELVGLVTLRDMVFRFVPPISE